MPSFTPIILVIVSVIISACGSGSSGTASPTAPTSAAQPSAPTNLTLSVLSHSQIDLNWSDNSSDETGFRVERCTGADCSDFAEIASVGQDVTSYSHADLTAQTVYRYRVLAFNAVGSSAYSNMAEAITSPLPVVSLTGTVRSKAGTPVSAATVKVLDGVNAGKTTTANTAGQYKFDGLTVGNGNLSAVGVGFQEARAGVYINGSNRLDFILEPETINPVGTWVGSGQGTASDGSLVTVTIEIKVVGGQNPVVDVWKVGYRFRSIPNPPPGVASNLCNQLSPLTSQWAIPVSGYSFERNQSQNNVFAYTPTVFKGKFVSANQITGSVTLVGKNDDPYFRDGCPRSATVEWIGVRQ